MSSPSPAPGTASQDPFDDARAELDVLITRLRSKKVSSMEHSEVEALVEKEGREVLRLLYQGFLDLRASKEVPKPVAGVDGVARTHQRATSRAMTTVFGDVEVKRLHMTAREAAGGLHPLDVELNVPPEQQSHHVQRRVGWLAANEPFNAVVESLGETCGAEVAKRQVEFLTRRAAQDFEAYYEESDPEPLTAGQLMVLTFDGKGIVMRPDGLREATRRAAEKAKPHLDHRTSPGEKKDRKRMAEVAAVYGLDPVPRTVDDILAELGGTHKPRPRPSGKRVWASVVKDPDDVIRDAIYEALGRDETIEHTWVILIDGQDEQLRAVKRQVNATGIKPVFVLDLIHVLEYLWKAAWCLFDTGDNEAEAWVTERLRRLLEGDSSGVAAGIRRSATKRGLDAEQRKNMDKCADYLLKYRSMLKYDEFLAAGFPIATGVIEGACRHLVQDRMDITGARWGLDGAESVLRLRSLRSSGDFNDYWKFHLAQERQRNHLLRYADHEFKHLREAA